MTEEQVIVGSPERDIHVTALVSLEKVKLSTQEENETEIYKMRSKLYRFVTDEEDGSTWKERGVGDVRILKHNLNGSYRIVMRRDKTLKICANHYMLPTMEIKNHASSDKALVWSTPSDFSDSSSQAETLCIRFGKLESATEFKEKFQECVNSLKNISGSDTLAKDLSSLAVKEEKDTNDNTKSEAVKGENKTDESETAENESGNAKNESETTQSKSDEAAETNTSNEKKD